MCLVPELLSQASWDEGPDWTLFKAGEDPDKYDAHVPGRSQSGQRPIVFHFRLRCLAAVFEQPFLPHLHCKPNSLVFDNTWVFWWFQSSPCFALHVTTAQTEPGPTAAEAVAAVRLLDVRVGVGAHGRLSGCDCGGCDGVGTVCDFV